MNEIKIDKTSNQIHRLDKTTNVYLYLCDIPSHLRTSREKTLIKYAEKILAYRAESEMAKAYFAR